MLLERTQRSQNHIDIHGHRGARGIMPENSLEGFAFTLANGVDFIELDIQLTRDDIIVATHDLYLSPVSTRDRVGNWLEDKGPEVISLSYQALQDYDIGGLKGGDDYSERFPDQAFLSEVRIPSLDQVIELIKEKGTHRSALNIEIKSDVTIERHRHRAERFIDLLLECLSKHGFKDRVLLQSFDWNMLDLLADKAPDLPRSYLSLNEAKIPDGGKGAKGTIYDQSPWIGKSDFAAHNGSIPSMVKAADGKIWAPYFGDLTAQSLKEAKDLGLLVNVWTVNEPEDIQAMIDLGVDGIITDYPGRAQRLLLKNGKDWR